MDGDWKWMAEMECGLRGWGMRVEEVWISDRNEGLCNIKKEKKTEREFDTLKLNFIFLHI